MRILLLITVLIAGCSVTHNSTSGTYVRSTELVKESQEISEREHQCIDAAVTRSNGQLARIAPASDPGSNAGVRRQRVSNDRERELAKCKATADREQDELSARERAEYQRQAEEERSRNSLMSILTTSLPR